MYLFSADIAPVVAPVALDDIAGAVVNAYLNVGSRSEAEQRLQSALSESGFRLVSINEVRTLEDREHCDTEASREHFDQALIDGECLVFHTWPLGEEDKEKEQ